MKTRTLGNSDIKVSEIAFGCMSLARNQTENQHLLDKAFDNGINFFDTADVYDKGWNEESVGKALRSKRKQLILASKVGNVWQQDGQPFKWDPGAKHILQSIDRSLKRLQTDYLDLYQLHGGTIEDNAEETINAFEKLKKAGKIRAYGISSIRPNVIRKYLSTSSIDSVMMQYSLLDRRPEEEALNVIAKEGVSVLARGALAQGLLTGKDAKDYLGHNKSTIASFTRLLKEPGYHPTTLATQYVLSHSVVASVVIGIRTEQHLLDAVQAVESDPLPPEIFEQLKSAIPVLKYLDHR